MTKLPIPILSIFNQVKNFSIKANLHNINLIGRNYLKSTDFHTDEIKSLLWTAIDLKHMLTHKCCEVNNIKSARITMLMHQPCLEIQASANSAANILKAHLNTIVDPQWDTREFVNDTGSFFSTCSDIIFCQSKYQSKIEKLAEGSIIPVVCVQSCIYAILNVLADIMAIQEKYEYLKNLKIGWIGTPCPLINTYLCIAPKLGINVQYCCACSPGAGMCPAALPVAKIMSEKKHTSLNECQNSATAMNKVNVIIVSKHNVSEFNVNLKHISETADKNWSFLHTLPRGTIEVTPEVFEHKNSLVWEAKRNLQWIYAALMVRLLSQYNHVNEMPNFDEDVKGCS